MCLFLFLPLFCLFICLSFCNNKRVNLFVICLCLCNMLFVCDFGNELIRAPRLILKLEKVPS